MIPWTRMDKDASERNCIYITWYCSECSALHFSCTTHISSEFLNHTTSSHQSTHPVLQSATSSGCEIYFVKNSSSETSCPEIARLASNKDIPPTARWMVTTNNYQHLSRRKYIILNQLQIYCRMKIVFVDNNFRSTDPFTFFFLDCFLWYGVKTWSAICKCYKSTFTIFSLSISFLPMTLNLHFIFMEPLQISILFSCISKYHPI